MIFLWLFNIVHGVFDTTSITSSSSTICFGFSLGFFETTNSSTSSLSMYFSSRFTESSAAASPVVWGLRGRFLKTVAASSTPSSILCGFLNDKLYSCSSTSSNCGSIDFLGFLRTTTASSIISSSITSFSLSSTTSFLITSSSASSSITLTGFLFFFNFTVSSEVSCVASSCFTILNSASTSSISTGLIGFLGFSVTWFQNFFSSAWSSARTGMSSGTFSIATGLGLSTSSKNSVGCSAGASSTIFTFSSLSSTDFVKSSIGSSFLGSSITSVIETCSAIGWSAFSTSNMASSTISFGCGSSSTVTRTLYSSGNSSGSMTVVVILYSVGLSSVGLLSITSSVILTSLIGFSSGDFSLILTSSKGAFIDGLVFSLRLCFGFGSLSSFLGFSGYSSGSTSSLGYSTSSNSSGSNGFILYLGLNFNASSASSMFRDSSPLDLIAPISINTGFKTSGGYSIQSMRLLSLNFGSCTVCSSIGFSLRFTAFSLTIWGTSVVSTIITFFAFCSLRSILMGSNLAASALALFAFGKKDVHEKTTTREKRWESFPSSLIISSTFTSTGSVSITLTTGNDFITSGIISSINLTGNKGCSSGCSSDFTLDGFCTSDSGCVSTTVISSSGWPSVLISTISMTFSSGRCGSFILRFSPASSTVSRTSLSVSITCTFIVGDSIDIGEDSFTSTSNDGTSANSSMISLTTTSGWNSSTLTAYSSRISAGFNGLILLDFSGRFCWSCSEMSTVKLWDIVHLELFPVQIQLHQQFWSLLGFSSSSGLISSIVFAALGFLSFDSVLFVSCTLRPLSSIESFKTSTLNGLSITSSISDSVIGSLPLPSLSFVCSGLVSSFEAFLGRVSFKGFVGLSDKSRRAFCGLSTSMLFDSSALDPAVGNSTSNTSSESEPNRGPFVFFMIFVLITVFVGVPSSFSAKRTVFCSGNSIIVSGSVVTSCLSPLVFLITRVRIFFFVGLPSSEMVSTTRTSSGSSLTSSGCSSMGSSSTVTVVFGFLSSSSTVSIFVTSCLSPLTFLITRV
uniref:Uncharacterized protein n=1 Tax=Glossina brevipalpis TaxID=37001 RepID=A0A1A9WLU2_9MUSC